MNIPDPTTLIPFLNQYNFWIRLIVIILLIIAGVAWFFVLPKKQYKNLAKIIFFLSIIIVVVILVFAYPKPSQDPKTPVVSQVSQQPPVQKNRQDQKEGIVLKDNLIVNCGVGVSAPKDANLEMDGNKFVNNKKSIDIRDK